MISIPVEHSHCYFTSGSAAKLKPRTQFRQRFTRAFFVQKLVQSQNVTRKKMFVRKTRA